jgi:hypothetical protein
VRRLIQVFALLVVVLAGSLPGLYLLGPARPRPCCADMPCPCPPPTRVPGPVAPCGLTVAPVAVAVAPGEQAGPRTEPSPLPPSWLAPSAARLSLAGPGLLARPGPPPGRGADHPAWLSVFRI